MSKVIGFIFKLLFILLLVWLFVDGFVYELKEPDIEFYIGCAIWLAFFVSMPVACLYGKIYGDARDATKFLNKEFENIQENYQLLYGSLKILRANLHNSYEPRRVVGYARTICESLRRVKRLYATEALDKYISEDERKMKFKKIDDELQRLNSTINSIEYSFFNKMTTLTDDIEQKRIHKVAKIISNELLELTHTAYFNATVIDPKFHEYTLPAEVLITTQYNIRTTEQAEITPNEILNMDYRIIRVFYPKGGYVWFSNVNNSFVPGETKLLAQTDKDGNMLEPKEIYKITLSHNLTETEVIQDRIIKKLESDKSKLEKKLEKVQKAVAKK